MAAFTAFLPVLFSSSEEVAQMKITRQTEYAIRTILELAGAAQGKVVPTRDISLRLKLPDVFLKKTIQLLAHAGLITTQRGTQGGVRLAVPPGNITIAHIIKAVEGNINISMCVAGGYECSRQGECRLHFILMRAQAAMLAELSRESIADLLKSE